MTLHRSFGGTLSLQNAIYWCERSTHIVQHVAAFSEPSIRRKAMKKILGVYNAPGQHWVGDGFPVRSLFSYNSHGRPI
jgi:hypothetical protein